MAHTGTFTLERLSKIRGANGDQKILSFFDTLDKYISDDEMKKSKPVKEFGIDVKNLRVDNSKPNPQTNLIINLFPDREDNYLKIPKVL